MTNDELHVKPRDGRPALNRRSLAVGARMKYAVRRVLLLLLALVGRLAVVRRPVAVPRHILVIKPDHLGDVLLLTPALRQLRRQYPQARIVALVGPWARVMLERNPDIDAVLTLPFPGFDRQRAPEARRGLRAVGQAYVALWRYALLLRAGAYDAALVLRDDHWWGAALALLAGIPRRIGHAVLECRPFLNTALPWDPRRHVSAQSLDAVAALSNDTDASYDATRFEPEPGDHVWAAEWLAQQGIDPGARIVAIHPGTGGASKLWLVERWAAVADALIGQFGVRVLLTGGPGEADLVAAVSERMQRPAARMVGAARVPQLAALLARAALVIGVDSGPLHIAVSQGAPSLHLFGPSDPQRFGPWGDLARHRVLSADLWCAPCGVFSACPRLTDPAECMERIMVAAVVEAAGRLLDIAEKPIDDS